MTYWNNCSLLQNITQCHEYGCNTADVGVKHQSTRISHDILCYVMMIFIFKR